MKWYSSVSPRRAASIRRSRVTSRGRSSSGSWRCSRWERPARHRSTCRAFAGNLKAEVGRIAADVPFLQARRRSTPAACWQRIPGACSISESSHCLSMTSNSGAGGRRSECDSFSTGVAPEMADFGVDQVRRRYRLRRSFHSCRRTGPACTAARAGALDEAVCQEQFTSPDRRPG